MAYLETTRRRSTQKRGTGAILKNGLSAALRRPESWVPSLFFILALGGWEWAARRGLISTLFFPAPSVIMQTLIRSFSSGELLGHTGATLSRVAMAFVFGGAPAMILGLAMGWSRRWRAALDSFIAAAHPLPKIALLPLVMIIFGIGESSKVITVGAAVFFPMLINCMAGVQQISPIYFEVANNFKANPFKVFTQVVWPGSLPMVIAGMRLALNIALLLTITVELVTAQEGLGVTIWFAWETLRTEELYAGLIVIAALGIGFNLLLQRFRLYLVPWRPERDHLPS